MWIGGNTKIVDFIEEALLLGISRKLPFLPRALNKGSIIYLASLQIKHVRDIRGKLKHQTSPVIFGEFMVDHIEFIVDEIDPALNQRFSSVGLFFEWITKKQVRKEPKRRDGKRLTAGTIYVVNYKPDIEDCIVKNRNGVFSIYDPFIEAKDLKFFRGIKKFTLVNYLKDKKNGISK